MAGVGWRRGSTGMAVSVVLAHMLVFCSVADPGYQPGEASDSSDAGASGEGPQTTAGAAGHSGGSGGSSGSGSASEGATGGQEPASGGSAGAAGSATIPDAASGGGSGAPIGGQGGDGPVSSEGGSAGEAGSFGGAPPVCSEGELRCANSSTLERCARDATWERQTVDFQSNGAHCGACGHDCLGGACQEGRCAPVTLASGQNGPWGISVDETFVYFGNTRAGTIARVAKRGGALPEVIADGASWPYSLLHTGGRLYFVDGNRVLSMKPDGSSVPTAFFSDADSTQVIQELATDGGTLFWRSNSGTLGGSTLVQSQPLGGTVVGTLGTGFPGGTSALGVGQHFAAFAAAGAQGISNNGFVTAVALTDVLVSEPRIADMQDQPSAIVVDALTVYWLNQGSTANSGRLMKAVLDDRNGSWVVSAPLASNLSSPRLLLVDETHLYWVNGAANTILKLAKSGGVPQIVASGAQVDTSFGMVQDKTSLYWTNYGNSSVMRLAK